MLAKHNHGIEPGRQVKHYSCVVNKRFDGAFVSSVEEERTVILEERRVYQISKSRKMKTRPASQSFGLLDGESSHRWIIVIYVSVKTCSGVVQNWLTRKSGHRNSSNGFDATAAYPECQEKKNLAASHLECCRENLQVATGVATLGLIMFVGTKMQNQKVIVVSTTID